MAEIITSDLEMIEDTQKDRYLTFSLGNESYGIEIRYVTEIIGFQEITKVPELLEYVKGVINLRGKILPVMDMRLRFQKGVIPYSERTCVIIIDIRDTSVGLIVDGVSEVITIPDGDIQEKPHMSNTASNNYIKSIGKVGNEVKLLIDCDRLISHDDLADYNEAI